MNNQQKAQAHKCEYKSRARMRKFMRQYGNRDGAVVIDVPTVGVAAWWTDANMSLRERQVLIEEVDRMTDGRFSQVMATLPAPGSTLTISVDPSSPMHPSQDLMLHLLSTDPKDAQ